MAIRVAPDTVCLDWPSVSNAVYDVRATVDLALPFATGMVSAVTAETDRCTAVVPRDKLTQFYQIGIRSGQAGE